MDKLFHHDVFVRYLEEESKDIDGYLQSGSASLIWSIFDIQEELNVSGNVAEIGVYHGKLLIYMCLKLNKGERAFAIDLFDSDPSIQGIKTAKDKLRFSVKNLESNLIKFGLGKDHVTILANDSQKLNEMELLSLLGNDEVRMFSVDGDHSKDGVRHDLNLATKATHNRGIIIVDDLFNTLCPSNTEGIIEFFRNDNLYWEPIAIAASNGPIKTGSAKLFLAHRDSALIYKAYLRLLNRENYVTSDDFLGNENVLVFDFQSKPTKYPIDDLVRQSVSKFISKNT